VVVTDQGRGVDPRSAIRVENRATAEHWKGNPLLGPPWTQIPTVVERPTRVTVVVALGGRHGVRDRRAVSETTPAARKTPQSLTWDREMKLADHKTVAVTTGSRRDSALTSSSAPIWLRAVSLDARRSRTRS
jgi:IS30 family transposase